MIRVPKCGGNIVFINAINGPRIEIFDMDRNRWPNIQILPDRRPVCTENS